MRLKSVVAGLALVLLAAPAQAWWGSDVWWGNDIGGIISWSPAIQPVYRDIAAAHCARWNKVATITSVHPWYGDFVGFACHFPRGYDPVKAYSYGTSLRVRY